MRKPFFLFSVTLVFLFCCLLVHPVFAATENKYCDGYDATYTAWTEYGASPYLDDDDTSNYIASNVDNADEGLFTFANTTFTTVTSVWLYVKIKIANILGLDEAWAYDSDDQLICSFAPLWTTYQWEGYLIVGLNTPEEVNDFTCYFKYVKVGSSATLISITCAYLEVTGTGAGGVTTEKLSVSTVLFNSASSHYTCLPRGSISTIVLNGFSSWYKYRLFGSASTLLFNVASMTERFWQKGSVANMILSVASGALRILPLGSVGTLDLETASVFARQYFIGSTSTLLLNVFSSHVAFFVRGSVSVVLLNVFSIVGREHSFFSVGTVLLQTFSSYAMQAYFSSAGTILLNVASSVLRVHEISSLATLVLNTFSMLTHLYPKTYSLNSLVTVLLNTASMAMMPTTFTLHSIATVIINTFSSCIAPVGGAFPLPYLILFCIIVLVIGLLVTKHGKKDGEET